MNTEKLHISKASINYIKTRFEDWKNEILDGKIWDSSPDYNLITLGTSGMSYEDRATGYSKTINRWRDLPVDKVLELLEDAEWEHR